MRHYKDTHALYQGVLDEVHASDELMQRIKLMDTKRIKTKRIKLISISAAAACLAAVIMMTVIIGSFRGKADSFVLKANAAEIGGEAFVEIAKVAPVGGESGVVVDGDKTTFSCSCIVPFALYCDGRNIKTITYSIENAVFLFPYDSYASGFRDQYPNEAAASDKITGKLESNHKIESNIEEDKQYAGYTVSFDNQFHTGLTDYAAMQRFPVCMLARLSSQDNLSKEARAAFAHLHSKSDNRSLSDKSLLNEIFNDFKMVHDEMLSKISVTAEITYEDGTTDAASLRFSCLSADQQNGIVIGAKTV